jgi:trigger factor
MAETITERLKITVTEAGPARREIEIEFSAAEAAKEYEDDLTAYAAHVKIRGFRQGNAPRELVKRMFGRGVEHSLVDRLVPRLLDEALASHHIRAAGVPAVEDVRFEEGGPLRFKAVVEIWPDFSLPVYTKLKLPRREPKVTDEDVDKSIEELRRKNADYVPVEGRGVAAGDYALVEIQGRDVKTKRLFPAERTVVQAGREGNDPAIEANIQGLRVDEEKKFTASYPSDHKNRKLAGKTVENRLKLISLKIMAYPEVNDDFAKRLGEFDSLAALKAKIRQELLDSRTKAARRETSEDAVQAVIAQTSIELPQSVLQEETEAILKSYASQIGSRGVTREAFEALQAQAKIQAERNLKQHLVIRRIAQVEGLNVTEEEVDQEIRAVAQASQVPLGRALESFREEGRRDNLRATLLARKVVDFLVGQAIIE